MTGGFTEGALHPAAATGAGYAVVTTRAQMNAVESLTEQALAALFGPGPLPYELDGDYSEVPLLSEMTAKALQFLQSSPSGFFLLVENENIDESAHTNNIERHLAATAELSRAVAVALDWPKAARMKRSSS